MAVTNVLLTHLLSRDAIELGRLVTSTQYPDQESKQPNAEPETGKQILTNFVGAFDREWETSHKFSLLGIASLVRKKSRHTSTDFTTATFVNYQLRNSDTFFRKACQEPGVCKFLEAHASRLFGQTFLVCGFKTIQDGHVTATADRKAKVGGTAAIPPEAIAAAAGPGAPALLPILALSDADVVAVEAETGGKEHACAEYDAPGEHIFAVQYRKVNVSFLGSDRLQKAGLGAVRWRLYGAQRGDGDEDGIAAALSDETVPSDLVKGEYDTFDLEGETFVYQDDEDVEEESEA